MGYGTRMRFWALGLTFALTAHADMSTMYSMAALSMLAGSTGRTSQAAAARKRGEQLVKQGRYDEAKKEFEKADQYDKQAKGYGAGSDKYMGAALALAGLGLAAGLGAAVAAMASAPSTSPPSDATFRALQEQGQREAADRQAAFDQRMAQLDASRRQTEAEAARKKQDYETLAILQTFLKK